MAELIVKKVIPKVWGQEEIIANSSYCQKRMTLERGYRCSIHYHRDKDETFVVESGMMLLEIEEEPVFPRNGKECKTLKQILMKPGDAINIRPFTAHRFTGLEERTIFYESSTHDESGDSIRITESEKVPAPEFVEILDKYCPRGAIQDVFV